VDIGENLEFGRDPNVISIGRDSIRDFPISYLTGLKRLDHAVLFAHTANPLVTLDGHATSALRVRVQSLQVAGHEIRPAV
jgi:hypothetical protein